MRLRVLAPEATLDGLEVFAIEQLEEHEQTLDGMALLVAHEVEQEMMGGAQRIDRNGG